MNGAHLHLLVNDVPILGFAFATVLLAIATATREPTGWARAGMLAIAISSLGGLLAFLTGSAALDVIHDASRTSGRAVSEHHQNAIVASILGVLPLLTGVVLATIATRRGSYPRTWLIATLVATAVAAVGFGWTGLAGGRINHPEIQTPADRSSGPAHHH